MHEWDQVMGNFTPDEMITFEVTAQSEEVLKLLIILVIHPKSEQQLQLERSFLFFLLFSREDRFFRKLLPLSRRYKVLQERSFTVK
jgi:hypothetical protein